VSLGVSVDIVRGAVDTADIILAEVNPQMPRTLGDSFLHVDHIAHLVPVDDPLPELTVEPLDDVCREIGHHTAQLIPNGATLQMGIGRIPDAVMSGLKERSDLGIHTEMLSDGVMALAKAGVITGRKKTLLPGKIVTSFIMGTRALYDWVDDNPAVEMRPSSFTNDSFQIARNDQMMAVNSALAVDLTGQVAADSIGGRFFSGIGGQVDFIRGAARSKGGKPIIALPSTAKNGEISRIVPVLEEGAGVVTSRGDIHYVVTEYGAADLWGKNIRQRTMALIGIPTSGASCSRPRRPGNTSFRAEGARASELENESRHEPPRLRVARVLAEERVRPRRPLRTERGRRGAVHVRVEVLLLVHRERRLAVEDVQDAALEPQVVAAAESEVVRGEEVEVRPAREPARARGLEVAENVSL
jgi:acyl CoA:acetate/3-ketoacid CoA transferase beta subunit